MEDKLLKNHRRYLERITFYKNFGYDIEEERKFILEKACPLYGNILEVGTGKGYFTVELAKEGYSFTSIDISDEEQELARLNIKYFGFEKLVGFRIEDAERLSFDDSSFDVIFSINTIHHLANPTKVIDELIRILTFRGKIIISDFTKEGFKIIDQIHVSVGKMHNAGQMTLLAAGNYFKNKKFSVSRYKSKFQDIIIAYRQAV